MGLSLTIYDIDGNFYRKSQTFPPPCIMRQRWRDSPWNWVPAPRVKKKTEWRGYRVDNKVWRYLQPSG